MAPLQGSLALSQLPAWGQGRLLQQEESISVQIPFVPGGFCSASVWACGFAPTLLHARLAGPLAGAGTKYILSRRSRAANVRGRLQAMSSRPCCCCRVRGDAGSG